MYIGQGSTSVREPAQLRPTLRLSRPPSKIEVDLHLHVHRLVELLEFAPTIFFQPARAGRRDAT